MSEPQNMRDRLVQQAQSFPHYVSMAETFDPAIAAALEGKALLASKTVWGTAITMAVTWGVSRYGLGWSPDVCAQVAGALTMVATVVLRSLTKTPVTGIVSNPGIAPPKGSIS